LTDHKFEYVTPQSKSVEGIEKFFTFSGCFILPAVFQFCSFSAQRIRKRVLEWKPMGRRKRGRPKKKWIEDIEKDIQIMGIRGWRKLCKERAEWKKITEKAKTHSGL
jgi:hypothetical protein